MRRDVVAVAVVAEACGALLGLGAEAVAVGFGGGAGGGLELPEGVVGVAGGGRAGAVGEQDDVAVAVVVRPVGAQGAHAGEEAADAAGGLEAAAQVLAPDVPDLMGEGGGAAKEGSGRC